MNPTNPPTSNAETGQTPRTDALSTWEPHLLVDYVVPSTFSRQLERENSRLLAQYEAMRRALEETDKFLSVIYSAIPFKKEIQDHLPYGLSDEIKDIVLRDSLGIRSALAANQGAKSP